jgi:hypothetical protein
VVDPGGGKQFLAECLTTLHLLIIPGILLHHAAGEREAVAVDTC